MVEWSSRYETGNQVVDSDHQQLIAILNSLEAALKAGQAKQELTRIIRFLISYTEQHFSREESIMLAVRCPVSGRNCQAHEALRGKIRDWATRLESDGPTTPLVLEIYRDTSKWITSHILSVDCHLRACH